MSSVLYLEGSSGNVRGMRNLELLRFVQQTENVTGNRLDFFKLFLDFFLICCLCSAFYKIITHYSFFFLLIIIQNGSNFFLGRI